MVRRDVRIIDSRSITYGLGSQVVAAARLVVVQEDVVILLRIREVASESVDRFLCQLDIVLERITELGPVALVFPARI